MRRLLLKNLVSRPVTEAAPKPDDAALAELAAELDRVVRRRLGRSLSIREVDAGSPASSRSTRSTTPSTISSGSGSDSSPRPVMPTCFW